MADVISELRQIRTYFQRSGEADLLPFLEGVGFMLLLIWLYQDASLDVEWKSTNLGAVDPDKEQYEAPASWSNARHEIGIALAPEGKTAGDMVPSLPTRLSPEQLSDSFMRLYRLSAPANSKEVVTPADIFNRYLIPSFVESILPGGRFPTPRHVADNMARILSISGDARILDPTCGSGGLLVAANRMASNLIFTGVELSISWARLAWINSMLHDINPECIRMRPGNSLRDLRLEDEADQFDFALVSPPFGNREDRALVKQALDDEDASATSSEIVFAELALKHLREAGTGIVLAPTGVLFRNSTAERELRLRLLHEATLKAVIAYPDDAFQPYSGVKTHAICFQKQLTPEGHAPWMFAVQHDGRTGVKNRHDDNQEWNQLPLVEAALLGEGETVLTWQMANGATIATLRNCTVTKADAPVQPGRVAAGFVVNVQQGDAAIRSLRAATQNNGGGRSSWIRLDASIDGARREGDFFVTQDADGQLEESWRVATESQEPVVWKSAANFVPEEPYWTIQVDDKEGESKSWQRLNFREANPWSITPNADNPASIAQLIDLDGDERHSVLVLDSEGRVVAHKYLDDREKLSSDKAYKLLGMDDAELGHLWVLDYRSPSGEDATHEFRGYLLVLNRPAQGFMTLQNGAKRGIAARITDSSPDGYIAGKLTEQGEVNRISVCFFAGEPWRPPNEKHVRGLCIDQQGTIIGLALPVADLTTRDSTEGDPRYDLQPSTYIPQAKEVATQESPARILGRVKRNQHRLGQHIDFLLGTIEQPSTRSLPEDFAPVDALFDGSALGPGQRAVWQEIVARTSDDTEAVEKSKTLFRAEEIASDADGFPRLDEVERTLELFSAMGMLVQVIVRDGRFYRRVIRSDVVATSNKASS